MIDPADFVRGLTAGGVRRVAGVPCSYLTPLIDTVIADPGVDYLSAPNEGDAVAAAAGSAIGGEPTAVLMQNSGLGNAVNPLASLVHPAGVGMLLIVTLRGDPAGNDEPQHCLMGRATLPLLETLDIPARTLHAGDTDWARTLSSALADAAEGRTTAIVVRKGTFGPAPRHETTRGTPVRRPGPPGRCHRVGARPAAPSGAPSRQAALRAIVDDPTLPRAIIIGTTGHTGRELYAIADRPNHLYLVGAMGCASAVGLGLARACPNRRVIIVDGDGAALMRLGNLAFLGAYGGGNVVHIVLDNGVHASTGGQATLAGAVSFPGLAAACGYDAILEGTDPRVIRAALDRAPGAGPTFVHLPIAATTGVDLPRPTLTPDAIVTRLRAYVRSAA
ncbi:MAG: phosphonopyruvate decarboxylase [Phycisphaerales bacterium]|nr:phosphonopyruvate decarboxylase [Phycisphaerae bacterium]NNF43211.1 phosphonopyruvate decarboxylase [Phycisphaerales bacterium]NNM26140.1 phosphonopyruvate decarboxylase [Phycisphaerales bacterium]